MDQVNWFPLDRIDELERAISGLVQDPSRIVQRTGIAMALGLHGLRVSEVTGARAAHFQPQMGTLHVRTLKGGRPRTVRLHESLAAAICQWRTPCESSQWLLQSERGTRLVANRVSEAGRDFLRSLGVTYRPRFHMLRHTFAMRLLAETDDLLLVRQQLGHCSIQTTMVYVEAIKLVPSSCQVRLYRPLETEAKSATA